MAFLQHVLDIPSAALIAGRPVGAGQNVTAEAVIQKHGPSDADNNQWRPRCCCPRKQILTISRAVQGLLAAESQAFRAVLLGRIIAQVLTCGNS